MVGEARDKEDQQMILLCVNWTFQLSKTKKNIVTNDTMESRKYKDRRKKQKENE